jgi:hypothetical protein
VFWPYLQTLDWAGQACQGQTFSQFLNYCCKKFYNLALVNGLERFLTLGSKMFVATTFCQISEKVPH